MENLAVVNVFYGQGHLHEQVQHLLLWNLFVARGLNMILHVMVKISSICVLHHDMQTLVLGEAFPERNNIGMLEL